MQIGGRGLLQGCEAWLGYWAGGAGLTSTGHKGTSPWGLEGSFGTAELRFIYLLNINMLKDFIYLSFMEDS